MEDPPSLVIVMPTYNEEECIEPVVDQWIGLLDREFPGKHTRFLIINDGSKDNTGKILEELKEKDERLHIIHQENGGHGSALLKGYHKAMEWKPEWVFQVDSDDQFVPDDFPQLWEKRHDSNFIIGHRKVRYDEPHRLVITRILRLVIFLLFSCRVKDSNIPYRLIKGPYLQTLLEQLPPQPFAPNIFLVILAYRDGQDLVEAPVTHQERETGSVSIVQMRLVKACIRSTKELLNFSMSLRRRLKAIQQARTEEKIA